MIQMWNHGLGDQELMEGHKHWVLRQFLRVKTSAVEGLVVGHEPEEEIFRLNLQARFLESRVRATLQASFRHNRFRILWVFPANVITRDGEKVFELTESLDHVLGTRTHERIWIE
jgi:hypothetical protein